MPWDERIKRRLKLRDLDILMTVIQTGSMGKAADRLNIFQPTISKSIADLEHTLGVRLLDRKPQGVEPTPYALVGSFSQSEGIRVQIACPLFALLSTCDPCNFAEAGD